MLTINKMYLPEIGGIEYVARDICKSIENEKHEVLCLNNQCKPRVSQIEDVTVYRLPSIELKKNIRFSLLFRKSMKSLSDNHEIRLFHFPSFQPEIDYVFTKKRKGIDICLYHADIVGKGIVGDIYNKIITKRFLKKMDYIVVTSPNIVKSSNILSEFKEKSTVIPLGVETEHFYYRENNYRNKIIQDFVDVDENSKIVLFVGRISRYKGIDILLESFTRLPDNYKLVIVSKDSLEKFDSFIYQYNLRKRIIHYNNVSYNELPIYYSAADLLVMPSTDRGEAFGLVALEAMACGKPVITTELGTGTSYHNIDGITGFVIKPGDINGLANAIIKVIEEKNFDPNIIINRANDFSMKMFKTRWTQFINSIHTNY